jgi:predicted transcriptional regulator
MSTQEKVARYLQERRKMVEAKTIAEHFLISTGTISKALQRLENEGKAVRQRFGNLTYWTWKREPVAFPQPTPSIQHPAPVRRPPPAQTSYPHIRGYDD